MNVAVLRAEAPTSIHKSFELAHGLSIDAAWEKGEPRLIGGVSKHTGFSSTIADVDNSVSLVTEIREFLTRAKTSGASLSSPELHTEIDIGITVGSSDQFTASLSFLPEDLELFAELGVDLRISIYPASDEEE